MQYFNLKIEAIFNYNKVLHGNLTIARKELKQRATWYTQYRGSALFMTLYYAEKLTDIKMFDITNLLSSVIYNLILEKKLSCIFSLPFNVSSFIYSSRHLLAQCFGTFTLF